MFGQTFVSEQAEGAAAPPHGYKPGSVSGCVSSTVRRSSSVQNPAAPEGPSVSRIAPTIAAFAPSALETLCRSAAAATADPIRRLHLPRQEAFHLSKPAHTSPASVRCCCRCRQGQQTPPGSGTFQWPSRPPNSDRRPPSW